MENETTEVEIAPSNTTSAVSVQEAVIRGIVIPLMGVVTVTVATAALNKLAHKLADRKTKKQLTENTAE